VPAKGSDKAACSSRRRDGRRGVRVLGVDVMRGILPQRPDGGDAHATEHVLDGANCTRGFVACERQRRADG
jgi:hypothetical protein